jgi:hypothetical protein
MTCSLRATKTGKSNAQSVRGRFIYLQRKPYIGRCLVRCGLSFFFNGYGLMVTISLCVGMGFQGQQSVFYDEGVSNGG